MLAVLIVAMDNRGGDSWGYYADGKLKWGLNKATYGVELDKLVKARTGFLHTRKATIGDATIANAHPFRTKHIIGCHNGSVTNWQSLNTDNHRKHEVDSMHIFSHLAEEKNMREICGWGTICYRDDRDPKGRINLLRFNGGDLAIYGVGDKDNPESPSDVIWASQANPIQWALALAGVKDWFSFTTKEEVKYYAQDGNLWVFENEEKMVFGARHAAGIWSEWQPRGGYGRNFQSSGSGATQRTIQKESPTGVATRRFVSSRQGLEGFYGREWCSFCKERAANLRCLITSMLYCTTCWANFEKITLFQKSKKPSTLLLCEICDDVPPILYSAKYDEILCQPCANLGNYVEDDDMLMDIPLRRYIPVSYGSVLKCMDCEQEQAAVYVREEGKTRLIGKTCLKSELMMDYWDDEALKGDKKEKEEKEEKTSSQIRLLPASTSVN